MHKSRMWLVASVGWTLMVAVLCLVQLNNLPDVGVSSPDKYIHSVFHFLFTIFWFLYLDSRKRSPGKNLVLVFLLSFVFGAIIELAQLTLTTTRTAEFEDLLANVLGAVLAVVTLGIYLKIKAKH